MPLLLGLALPDTRCPCLARPSPANRCVFGVGLPACVCNTHSLSQVAPFVNTIRAPICSMSKTSLSISSLLSCLFLMEPLTFIGVQEFALQALRSSHNPCGPLCFHKQVSENRPYGMLDCGSRLAEDPY